MENNTDKIFRDKLQSYPSPVSKKVWEGVALGLNQSTTGKRRYLVWLILLFAGISIGGYFIFFGGKNTEKESLNAPVALMKRPKTSDPDQRPDLQLTVSPVNQNSEPNKEEEAVVKSIFRSPKMRAEIPGPGLRIAEHNMPVLSELETVIQEENKDKNATVQMFGQREYCYPATLPGFSRYDLKAISPGFRKTKTLGDCFERPKSKYFLSLEASLDYPVRRLDAGLQSEWQNYIDERKATESEKLSFHMELTAGYIHPMGWIAKTGIQYTQLNERFLLVKENVIKRQTQITIDTLYNSDGSFTIHRDTSILEVLGKEELKTDNQFRMLDIPILFGYQFFGDRFSLEVNTGVIVNIASFYSGRMYNTSIVPTYYGNINNHVFQPYKTRVGLSIYGGFSILTNIINRSQFYIEPNVRYYIRSFSNSGYPIRQHYFTLGISTGMRYYF